LWEEGKKINEELQLEIPSLRKDLNEKGNIIKGLNESADKSAEVYKKNTAFKDQKLMEFKKMFEEGKAKPGKARDLEIVSLRSNLDAAHATIKEIKGNVAKFMVSSQERDVRMKGLEFELSQQNEKNKMLEEVNVLTNEELKTRDLEIVSLRSNLDAEKEAIRQIKEQVAKFIASSQARDVRMQDLQSKFSKLNEDNKVLEEENVLLKQQLLDFQRREEERVKEESNRFNDKKDKDEDKKDGDASGNVDEKGKQEGKDQSGASGDSDRSSDKDKSEDKERKDKGKRQKEEKRKQRQQERRIKNKEKRLVKQLELKKEKQEEKNRKEKREQELIALNKVRNEIHDKVVEGLVLLETKVLGLENRFKNAEKSFVEAYDLNVTTGLERLYKDVKWLSKLQDLSHHELKEKYQEIFKDITLENTEYFRTRTNNFVDYMTLKENEVKELIQQLKEAIITKNRVQNQPKEKKKPVGISESERNTVYVKPRYILQVVSKEQKTRQLFQNSSKEHLAKNFLEKEYLCAFESRKYDDRMTLDEWELQKSINSYMYSRVVMCQRKEGVRE